MTKTLSSLCLVLLATTTPSIINAFNPGMTTMKMTTTSSSSSSSSHQSLPSTSSSHQITRRTSFSRATAALVTGVVTSGTFGSLSFPQRAMAEVDEETPRVYTRMGGLLEKYQDGTRGWQIMIPSGWNKFEGEVGAYDVKWQDVVDNRENIKISSNPVKSTTTSISALGEVKEVGQKLAASRNAKLVRAEERLTEGILFFTFEFALDEGTHQLLCLSVNKGKIWSLDANTTEKRWSKRKDMYDNVVGSFMPKLT